MRLRLIVLASFAVAAPVTAQVASTTPRFEVAPGATGVTRVDTATGAVSHCTESSGVWFCERVGTPAPSGSPDPAADVKKVSDAVAALSSRVDGLAGRLDKVMPASSSPGTNAAGSGPRALTAEVVARFVAMIRRLKQQPHAG
jgi:hypothetical protein